MHKHKHTRSSLTLGFIASCVLTLSACQTPILSGPLQTTTPVTREISLDGQRAVYLAEVAYQGWTISAEAALNSGALTASQRQQIRDIDQRAWAAVQAVQAGNAGLSAVLTVVAEAQGLVAVINSHHQ